MNLLSLLSVVSCLFYCQVHAAHNADEKVCRKFRTRKLRKACLRTLGSTENLRPALSLMDERQFNRHTVAAVPPGTLKAKSKNSMDNGVGYSLNCTTSIRCPIFDLSAISEDSRDHIRNTSPWEYCTHEDLTRFPPRLQQAVCLCHGCLDPRDGRPRVSLVSRPITTTISVIRKKSKHIRYIEDCDDVGCQEEKIDIDVGCYCSIPLQQS